VNNAGVEGETGPIEDATVEDFSTVHDTNVLGVFLSMKHELRAKAAAASSTSPRPTGTRRRPVQPPMSAASSRWKV
jgi:NAD(P)-dependent dehydrogenase (short-subunit alcohol dehydrogenase family)